LFLCFFLFLLLFSFLSFRFLISSMYYLLLLL